MRLTRRFTAAGLTAATLAIAGATATSASAATLSPPVIKEKFTLLACPKNPTTTIGIEGCAEHQIVSYDKQIDTLNAEIFKQFGTKGPGQKDFITANTAWLNYRNSYCNSESDIYAGGTESPVIWADCAVVLDKEHVSDLKSFLGEFNED